MTVAWEVAVVGKGSVHSVPWPSDGTLTVGRDARSGLCLDAASVSRQHLVLRVADGRFTVEDVGSANGTFLHGDRLPTGRPAALSPGDAVYVGDFALIVRGVRGDAGGLGDDERLHESPLGSPAMRAVYEHIDSVAPSTINVLILGETGVGKDIVAQALHARSGRRGPLVRVNCAALSASLLESELFGHERGAFTGAHSAKPGLLEVAAGGSAFLDEVGEMPLALQSTLLHAIETREVQRVGSVTPRAVDVRFIAATNRPLEADAASGRFRANLYYRLAGFTIAVPPLRERREDILPLAEAMLARLSARAGLPSPPQLNEEAERRLVAHAWPGNVRELRNVIERALLLANGRTIDVSHLPSALAGGARPVAPR